MTGGGSGLPPVSAPIAASFGSPGDMRATIVAVPPSLQALAQAVQVDGRIAQVNSDGTVTIATPQGDLTAKVWTGQPLVAGQPIQLDLQAGNPPRLAVARLPDPVTAPPQPAIPPLPSSTPAPGGNQAPPPPGLTTAQTPATAQPGGAPATISQPTEPSTPVIITSTTAPPVLTQPSQAQATPPPASPPQNAVSGPTLNALLENLPTPHAIPAQPVLSPGIIVRLTPLPDISLVTTVRPSQTVIANAGPLPQFPGATAATPEPATGPAFPIEATREATTPLGSIEGAGPKAALPTAPTAAPKPPGLDVLIKGFSAVPVTAQTGTPAAAPRTSGTTGVPAPTTTLADDGEILSAIVTGFTAEGLPVVAVDHGLAGLPARAPFVMNAAGANLATGMTILLTPAPEADAAAPMAGLPLAADQASDWPAMQDLTRALAAIGPASADHIALLPNLAMPAPILAATVLLFVAAVRNGDLSTWLGSRGVDALRRNGGADLLAKLGGEVRRAGDEAARPNTDDWHPFPLPLFQDGAVGKAMVWYRRNDAEDAKDETGKRQTRFVMDIDLSRMGPVQLDGLAKSDRIDLIVRTRAPLGATMRQTMRQKYQGALDRLNWGGDLNFQDAPEKFIRFAAR